MAGDGHSWLATLPSSRRLTLALTLDGLLAGLAFQGASTLFPITSAFADPWLVFALTLGALWVLLSVGLYRNRAAYFGAGSRRRRLLGGILILLYAFLLNEVAGAPLAPSFLLTFSGLFYLAVLGSRLLARRILG